MHLSLPERLEIFAQQQVGEGLYSSTSEYVRALIRQDMTTKEQQRRQAFYAAVQHGDMQLAQGQGIDFTDTTMQELVTRAKQNVTDGNRTVSLEAIPE